MPDPNCVPFLEVPLAYAGPGAGLELIPYFLALLAWAGLALGAVCLWPITAFLRRLRKGRSNHEELRNREAGN